MDADRRRAPPPGGAFETWTMADGWPLRVGVWPGGRGALVFLGGRADFAEKYAEALWWWRDRGWAVVAPDWRGQGGSGRLGATRAHGHAAAFGPWLADLRDVIGRAAALPGPLVAVGHSMGGHLLLRALAEGETRLARVALTAPMLGIARVGRGAGWLARLVAGLGAAGAFAPGQRARDPAARRPSALTSCPERAGDEAWWFARDPALELGGVTWGWLAAAHASLATLRRPGALERVRTPVLALLAADERVTDNRAAMRALARLPLGGYAVTEGRHELLREADGPRLAALRRLDDFLERAWTEPTTSPS